MNEVPVLEKKSQVQIYFYLSKVAICCFSLLGVCQALSESQNDNTVCWSSAREGANGYDLNGGTLLICIQICPFKIKFMNTFQDDQRTIKLTFWDSERFLTLLVVSKLQIFILTKVEILIYFFVKLYICRIQERMSTKVILTEIYQSFFHCAIEF